jgi:hypothetical protein
LNRHERRAAEARARQDGHGTPRKIRRARKRAARVLGEARELIASNGWMRVWPFGLNWGQMLRSPRIES